MKKLPNWISTVLRVGGILNFLLAVGLVFFSESILAIVFPDLSGSFRSLWLQVSAIGFITLGLGYFVASFNPLRNSVVLLMGISANLLGLIFIPLHFGLAAFTNGFLATGMLSMIAWIGLLLLMLYHFSKAGQESSSLARHYNEPLSRTLNRFRTQKGKSLLRLSNEKPVLVIFLRPFGAAICRQALAEIKQKQAFIEEEGTRLVFVHLEEEEKAREVFQKAGLENKHRISDPNGIMYHAFGLDPSSFVAVSGWKNWAIRLKAIFSKGGTVIPGQEAWQLPGIFLINQGEIIKSYRHEKAAEKPDFVSLANGKAA